MISQLLDAGHAAFSDAALLSAEGPYLDTVPETIAIQLLAARSGAG